MPGFHMQFGTSLKAADTCKISSLTFFHNLFHWGIISWFTAVALVKYSIIANQILSVANIFFFVVVV